MEGAFRALIDSARQAGWNEVLVAVALGELADNYVLEIAETGNLAEQLDKLRRR
jgi:hypothetical protein